MSGTLQINTLGGLSINLDGKPVTGLVSRKTEAILIYLACTRRTHPRKCWVSSSGNSAPKEHAHGQPAHSPGQPA